MKNHQQTIAAMTREELQACLRAIVLDASLPNNYEYDTLLTIYKGIAQTLGEYGLDDTVEFDLENDD